jgi:hypothetical protein
MLQLAQEKKVCGEKSEWTKLPATALTNPGRGGCSNDTIAIPIKPPSECFQLLQRMARSRESELCPHFGFSYAEKA